MTHCPKCNSDLMLQDGNCLECMIQPVPAPVSAFQLDISDIIYRAIEDRKKSETILSRRAEIERTILQLQNELRELEKPGFCWMPQWKIDLDERIDKFISEAVQNAKCAGTDASDPRS